VRRSNTGDEKGMYFLGISGGFRPGNRDGAACLVRDGRIIAAAEEERFTRIKHSPGCIPLNAIRYCISEAGISFSQIDEVVFAGATYKDIKNKLNRFFVFNFGTGPKIKLVEHHIAHAASAFFVSGFESSNILTMDLSGDGISTLMAYGKGRGITKLKEFPRSNSLGAFYNIITQYLGFRRNTDEYKVMGLASYGKPSLDLSWLLKASSDGYVFNKSAIVKVRAGESFPSVQEPMYSGYFLNKLKRPRKSGTLINKYHMDLAESAQKKLESVICRLAEQTYVKTKNRNFCIAGGVGLNCVANAKLKELPFVDNVFVQPASNDAGLAMGCALKAAADKGFKFKRLRHVYYGPGYSNRQIENTLKHVKSSYRRCANLPGFVAKKLSEGNIIGWFQGRMEYGPRALGARSILADPRSKGMKDRVNHTVKFRESFRPFAPSILVEHANEYFVNCENAPFMTINFTARRDKRNKIPAVVHVDGTSRVQTVSRKNSVRYYDMIKEFYRITSIPIVLNTSFNVREEPVVCTPYQAIATFYESGLDYLAIGDFILKKDAI